LSFLSSLRLHITFSKERKKWICQFYEDFFIINFEIVLKHFLKQNTFLYILLYNFDRRNLITTKSNLVSPWHQFSSSRLETCLTPFNKTLSRARVVVGYSQPRQKSFFVLSERHAKSLNIDFCRFVSHLSNLI
jgi:hypothetical protein